MEHGAKLKRLVFFILLLAGGSVVYADVAFEQGVSAFKQQNYQQAIEYFFQSRKQGNKDAILTYNLASSYYKLGQHNHAQQYFTEASADVSLAGLSFYNIGLIALKRNDSEAAQAAFSASFKMAEDDRVKVLAARQLEALGVEKSGPASGKIKGFVSLSLANNDNVTRVNDDIPSVANSSDSYLDFYGTSSYQLSGDNLDGVQLKAALAVSHYADLSAYNDRLLSAGVYFSQPLFNWRSRVGLVFYHDSIDAVAFQQRASLKLRADRKYAPGQRFRLKYDLTLYNDLDPSYAYLSGHKQRFTLENRSRFDVDKLRLGYTLEVNSRDDLSVVNSFVSASPTRHTLYASVARDFSDNWSGLAKFDYRNSNYGDANVSAGVDLGVREEDRSRYSLIGIYNHSRNSAFELMWRHTSNDSNYSSENYSSNLIMVSANHYFD